MNYFNFHIGDWEKTTRLLSPMEKGVYLDLLTLYYTQESPLMRTQCERIAKAYANDEREALKYVLDTFFELKDDSYVQSRCEEEILKKKEKSVKAQRSANSRWSERNANAYANASETHMRNGCERDANSMLSNNQYPINNIHTSNLDDVNAEFQLASEAEMPEPTVPLKENHNPPVPYKEVQTLFNTICVPGCRKCSAMTKPRQTLVRCRMADLKTIWGDNGVENFRRLFTIVSKSDFLMGRSQPSNGHESWRAGFDWVLNPTNMMKIIDGNYGESETVSAPVSDAQIEKAQRDKQAFIESMRERERRMAA